MMVRTHTLDLKSPRIEVRSPTSATSHLLTDPSTGRSSLRLPEKRKPRRTRCPSRFLLWWTELLALLVSFICLGLICFLGLYAANVIFPNQAVADFHGIQWSVNSMVALLSTLQRSTMLYVLGEVIGHLKWSWFEKPRPLLHLERFDNASRGVWGSLRFIFTSRPHIAHLGAIAIAISWAIGPFYQQSIRTVQCFHKGEAATIPIARSVPRDDIFQVLDGSDAFDLDVVAKSAAIKGLVNPKGNDTAIPVSCQSGNCTFDSYLGITHSSIGLCSKCAEITSLMTEEKPLNVSLNSTSPSSTSYPRYKLTGAFGNDTYLAHENDETWLRVTTSSSISWAKPVLDPEFLALINTTDLFAFIHTMSFTTAPCTVNEGGLLTCPHRNLKTTLLSSSIDMVAVSCYLYPCLQNYFGEVRNGTFHEKLVSTAPASFMELPEKQGTADPTGNLNFTAVKSPCLVDKQVFDASNTSSAEALKAAGHSFTMVPFNGQNISVPDECIYSVPHDYLRAFQNFLFYNMDEACISIVDPTKISCEFSWWITALYNAQKATVASISEAVGGMTTALTNQMRVGSGFAQGIANRDVAVGDNIVPNVCTTFQWAWLVYPAVLLVATTAILGVVMAGVGDRSDGVAGDWEKLPTWKTSVLPIVYYGGIERSAGSGSIPRVSVADHEGGVADAPESTEPRREPVMDLDELRDEAKKTVVRFGKDGSGWKFL